MISTAQIRAAHGLLKRPLAALTHPAALSAITLDMIEDAAAHPRRSKLAAIKVALAAGETGFPADKDVVV